MFITQFGRNLSIYPQSIPSSHPLCLETEISLKIFTLRLLLSGRDCSGGDHDWFYTPPPPGAGERQKERERQSRGASVGDKKGGSGLFIPSIEVRPADCHP